MGKQPAPSEVEGPAPSRIKAPASSEIERLVDSLHTTVADRGFAFAESPEMRQLLERSGSLGDWNRFAASWNDLALDTYMRDGGRYRRRRHAVYEANAAGIMRGPHQAHYQTLEYNPLHGGIARWFEPIDAAIGDGETMTTVLAASRAFFESLTLTRQWHVEVHQFRIEARPGEQGRPTPEGVHRDGVDYVLVLLIDRVNIASGTTTVHAAGGSPPSGPVSPKRPQREGGHELGSFTLAAPLDAALLDDARVAHGVTPIEPVEPDRPAYRDVLVVTWLDWTKRAAASAHR